MHPWDEAGEAKYGKQLVRTEDWDEIGDYLPKMLRYVQYGEKRDFIYARLGELASENSVMERLYVVTVTPSISTPTAWALHLI